MTRPLAGPILTAREMRAAEDEAVAGGASVAALMERAGKAVADTALRMGAGRSVLILAGPGNNGGDGYVAARRLAEAGVEVRIARSGEPASEAARDAARRWTGPVGTLSPETEGASVVVDALFGTGLKRPLDETLSRQLIRLADAAHHRLAVDLPSGVASDDGRCLGDVPRFDATLALGAAKPAHLLLPAAALCGRVLVADIGIAGGGDGAPHVLVRPDLAAPRADAHKYSRGMVALVAGAMGGAALLASAAALRGGAGYAMLVGGKTLDGPHALVRHRFDERALDDDRIGAIVVGCGLGRGEDASNRLDACLAAGRPLVIDGDALSLIGDNVADAVATAAVPTILTPHGGEFDRLFGKEEGSKIDRTRAAAKDCGAVVIHKGADSVIAAPDGQVRVSPLGSPWLASAGTGDVLAGLVGARLAATGNPFAAACEAVWLHGEAARLAGPSLIADDLPNHLSTAIARCL